MKLYRGETPGDTRRIRTGDATWDEQLFVTDDPAKARDYGAQVKVYDYPDDAKTLREGSREWRQLMRGYRPPHGKLLEIYSEAVRRAIAAGYDLVWFTNTGDTGIVVLDRTKLAIGESLRVSVFHGERPGGSGMTRGEMVYLTPSRETAEHYARVNHRGEVEQTGGPVHQLTLQLEKPLDLRPLGKETTREGFNAFLEGAGIDYSFGSNAPDRGPVWMYFRYDRMSGQLVTGFVDRLKLLGYDGLILFDNSSTYGDPSGLTYVAFSAKSLLRESAARRIIEAETGTGDDVLYHVARKSDLPSIQRQGLEPRVGTRSLAAEEADAAVYFFPDIDSAEDAVANWLGDEFDEDEELVLLAVSVPANSVIKGEVEWECTVKTRIPPENISVARENF